ncbi:helix-turn-helix transcriptional regulator [Antrihabitans cavernicola]|uniref:HTH luxR-type domain-containing protein n=1 Tax=Antrihabitans cavernicola TaxID=2495913 RepID=A0A5A7S9L2_9NOCA|nr:LuxR C-terminal-related transcriptional regulator [Spelaeibacter cavernicola]KAA0020142.1 hypothetical protein FOY51_21310 [Spelaeibacter cavernicola]
MSISTRLQWRSTGVGLIDADDVDIDSFRLPTLIGRDREVGEIRNLIDDPRVSLLTLTGPAGVGKSRIVQEALTIGEFQTGHVTTIDVAEANTRADVWNAVSAAVSCEIDCAAEVVDVLAVAIGAARTILVMDNCDRVSAAIAHDVSRLLGRCPNLLIVGTSRVVFNLHREYVVNVRPLQTRSESGPSRPASSPAAQVLLAGIDSRYRNSAPNRLILDEIAHEVDGVPLALELAANTINRIGSARTLQLIRSGEGLAPLPFLDVPARHRCLDDAIDWGMHLDSDTIDVLLHLSLCESAVEPDTVSNLVDMDESLVSGTLATLIDHSLVQRGVTDAGQPSYRLLAPTRTYCHHLLNSDRSRGDRIRREHVDRSCESALATVRDLRAPDRRSAALDDAEQRVGDFAATVDRLIEMGHAQRAVELAESLEDVWIRFGYLSRIERMLSAVVDNPPAPTESLDPALPHAGELLGKWALQSGRSRRTIEVLTNAAAGYDRIGDAVGACRVAAGLGIASLEVGRHDLAREHLKRALRRSDRGSEPRSEVVDLYLAALAISGSADRNDSTLSDIDERMLRLDADADRLRAHNTVARTHLGAGDACRALEQYRRALRIPSTGSHVLETLTAVAGCAAAYAEAGPDFGESASILFGAVHYIGTARALPQPERNCTDDGKPAHLIRPETAWELRDVVAYALSGPAIPAPAVSALDALTTRQREIALLVADGLTNRMIASKLGIAEWTVINHLRQVMSRLDCPSRLHVALVVKGETESGE